MRQFQGYTNQEDLLKYLATLATVILFSSLANAGLRISVDPSSNALIGPGPQASCIDLHDHMVDPAKNPKRSLLGPVLSFRSFNLNWKSPEYLQVLRTRVAIRGIGISGRKFVKVLEQKEIEAMLGRPNGIVEPHAKISSRDPNRAGAQRPACGLKLGSVPLVFGGKTAPFMADVVIEMTAKTHGPDGSDRILKSVAQARAYFHGI